MKFEAEGVLATYNSLLKKLKNTFQGKGSNMRILSNFNENQLYVINIIKYLCKSLNIEAYIVGGAVRDSILKKNTKDIDICINENPNIIIDNLTYIAKYEYHIQFQTSTIEFNNGIVIDLIRCRKETYTKNGALPVIEPSNIEEDLLRRDFTINALAYDIINDELIDLFNGLEDLKKKQLKKIHNNSYAEDPTRIFRAIKYSVRYDLELYDENEILFHIRNGDINSISADRIIKEVVLMCKEEEWIKNMIKSQSLGIFKLEEKHLGLKNYFENYTEVNLRTLNLFYCLIDEKYIDMFIKNSILDKKVKKAIKFYYYNKNNIVDLLLNVMDNYKIYEILNKIDFFVLILLCWNEKLKYKIINYVNFLKDIRINMNINCLREVGINDGKEIGNVVKYLMTVKLNIGINNEEEYLLNNLGEILKCL